MGYLGAHRNDPAEGNPIMQRGWGWNFWSNHLEFEQSNAMQCTRKGLALDRGRQLVHQNRSERRWLQKQVVWWMRVGPWRFLSDCFGFFFFSVK